jgi:hypothetical protein
MMKMPEALRAKVATLIGQREWRDELLAIAGSRDLIVKTLADIANKPGFLDSTSLKKIQSMAGRWASITAVAGLAWEKVGAGFDTIFNQVTDAFIRHADSFNFDSITEHVSAFVDGLREGFGLKDWGEAIDAIANEFNASTLQRWKDFGQSLAATIRGFATALKLAYDELSPVIDLFGPRLAGAFTGLALALAILSPVLGVLATLAGGLIKLGRALRSISWSFLPRSLGTPAGEAAGGAVGGSLLKRLLGRIGLAGAGWLGFLLMGDGRPDNSPGDLKALQDELEKARKSKQGKEKQSSAEPKEIGKAVGEEIKKSTLFGSFDKSNVMPASFVTRSGGGQAVASYSGVGRKFIGGLPSIMKAAPGTALPSMGGGIIRRSDVPSFSGGGGSMAGDLSRSAFERKFAGTPLAGKYDAIVAAARANNISPSLLAGVIAHETGNGHVLSGNNPAGMMDPRTGMARKQQFSDLDAGINAAARVVSKNWRRSGGDLDKMGDIYAPVGAANDPRHLNGGWSAGVRKQMNAMTGASSGSAGSGDAVGWAEKFKGMSENNYSDARVLASALGGDVRGRSNAWCARFVNHALASAGGKGTGSNVANSYQRWGNAVNPSNVKRNDVILQTRGRGYNQPGGHVGLATGETRMHNGRLQVKMIAGNDGDSVREHWVDVDGNTMVRRGAPVTSQVPSASDVIQNVPASKPPANISLPPAMGGGSGGPVTIHINGSSHDPEALATLVQRRIDESMNWRLHDTASEYT